ncbi:MAG: hypothetical protein KAS32_05445 [Candidatus Peribacteraceae bacterium]|nr:hypothetical protein [Candidatus Peribacteraceae bacterium]
MADYNSAHTGAEIDADVAVAFGRFVDTTIQALSVAGTPEAITLNTNSEVENITHSTSVDAEEITFSAAGLYVINAQPQVQNNGGTAESFYMWIEIDTGGGFAEMANTNIKLDLGSNDDAVTTLEIPFRADVGDKIKLMVNVTHINVQLFTESPANGPVVPSIIVSLFKAGR